MERSHSGNPSIRLDGCRVALGYSTLDHECERHALIDYNSARNWPITTSTRSPRFL